MPPRARCVWGTVRTRAACRPAFDYGRQIRETLIEANGAIFKAGNFAEFVLAEGKS